MHLLLRVLAKAAVALDIVDRDVALLVSHWLHGHVCQERHALHVRGLGWQGGIEVLTKHCGVIARHLKVVDVVRDFRHALR